MNCEELHAAVSRAEAYAAANMRELATEICRWRDTAYLTGDKLRTLASLCVFVDENQRLTQAEHLAIRAALNYARGDTP